MILLQYVCLLAACCSVVAPDLYRGIVQEFSMSSMHKRFKSLDERVGVLHAGELCG